MGRQCEASFLFEVVLEERMVGESSQLFDGESL